MDMHLSGWEKPNSTFLFHNITVICFIAQSSSKRRTRAFRLLADEVLGTRWRTLCAVKVPSMKSKVLLSCKVTTACAAAVAL